MTKKTSYGIIETIGGFVMARSYRHIQQYEREILELKERGMTQKEIAQQLGFTKEQVKAIAEQKMPDLNAASIETAMSMVEGTARSMGVVVTE